MSTIDTIMNTIGDIDKAATTVALRYTTSRNKVVKEYEDYLPKTLVEWATALIDSALAVTTSVVLVRAPTS